MKRIIIVLLAVFLFISIIINFVLLNIKYNYSITEIKEGSISEYTYMLDNYIPENGYVPDAITAVKIAQAIFKNLGKDGGEYIVEYDDIEQLWIVQNASIFRNGGYVIIQKSDGKIVTTWLSK